MGPSREKRPCLNFWPWSVNYYYFIYIFASWLVINWWFSIWSVVSLITLSVVCNTVATKWRSDQILLYYILLSTPASPATTTSAYTLRTYYITNEIRSFVRQSFFIFNYLFNKETCIIRAQYLCIWIIYIIYIIGACVFFPIWRVQTEIINRHSLSRSHSAWLWHHT